MVKAVACDREGGIVVGYSSSFRLPGQASVATPAVSGDTVLGRRPNGAWISSARTIAGGRWRGPARIFLNRNGTDLGPERFGGVGRARTLSIADSFAVRFGNLLADGRVLLAAGWQPSQSPSRVENMPWAFFAWDFVTATASPMTAAIESTATVNQNRVQAIAGSADGAHLVVATHDGETLYVARFEAGASRPARLVMLRSPGAASALAVSGDGETIAIGSESRGRDSPAHAWLIDAAGKVAWSSAFEKTVIGVHFVPGPILVVAGAEARAGRVPLPPATATGRGRGSPAAGG